MMLQDPRRTGLDAFVPSSGTWVGANVEDRVHAVSHRTLQRTRQARAMYVRSRGLGDEAAVVLL